MAKVIIISEQMAAMLSDMANGLEKDGYRLYPETLRYLLSKADETMTTAEFDSLPEIPPGEGPTEVKVTETFASISVTKETQDRFNTILDRLGNVGSDEFVNRVLDGFESWEKFENA